MRCTGEMSGAGEETEKPEGNLISTSLNLNTHVHSRMGYRFGGATAEL